MSDGGTATGDVELKFALRERFNRLAELTGLDMGHFELLDGRYSEPTRCYHSWKHIAECLEEFDRVSPLLRDPVAVELALWFHDAIYSAGSDRNELDSAALAYESVRPINDKLAHKVRQFIEATDYSRPALLIDHDLDYLKDIDFSPFGKPFDAFWQDVEHLRRENGEKRHSEAAAARLEFYRSILEGDFVLYRTGFFRDRLQERALFNVRRAIAHMEHAGD